jgi:carbon-monoxide dehydrogenase small subunit
MVLIAASPICGAQIKRVLMAKVSLIVNGNPVTANIDPRTLLVQFLREHLRLTGTHVGCDTSQCGACVVHLDGKAVKSCTTLIMTAVDLVHRKGHDLSEQVIREELEGNLCRCTGYQNIVQSIAAGAKAMAKSDLA